MQVVKEYLALHNGRYKIHYEFSDGSVSVETTEEEILMNNNNWSIEK